MRDDRAVSDALTALVREPKRFIKDGGADREPCAHREPVAAPKELVDRNRLDQRQQDKQRGISIRSKWREAGRAAGNVVEHLMEDERREQLCAHVRLVS